jgi:hypothetical protein
MRAESLMAGSIYIAKSEVGDGKKYDTRQIREER